MMNTIRRPDMDKTTASKSLKNRPTTLKLEYPIFLFLGGYAMIDYMSPLFGAKYFRYAE